jgi:hypothetical protein
VSLPTGCCPHSAGVEMVVRGELTARR